MTGTAARVIEAGIVGAGIDHHRVAVGLQPAPVDIFVDGLEGLDQRVIGGVPGAGTGQIDHGLFRQRDFDAEFASDSARCCGGRLARRMPRAER